MSKDDDAPGMEFEFQVTLKRVRRPRAAELPPEDPRLHPLVHTLVLAHRFKAMGQEGKSHMQAGRDVGLSGSRVAGVSRLLLLSPKIQEAILTATPERLATLTVYQVRRIALTPDWGEQAAAWAKL